MNDLVLAAANGSGLTSILMIVVLFGLMYFMMIRPQRKAQEKKKEMMGGMGKGDSVVTIGGLHGVINSIDKQAQTVELDIEGVYLTFDLRAIGRVDKKTTTPAAPTSNESDVTSDSGVESSAEANHIDDSAATDQSAADDKTEK
ncbi:preprotein translocase subunit YajC [Loigolactobacillus coryniformis]|jgi:preprotein translocase subunit YajC|uniref:Preprotein translocase, YajC subunit n=4 Tax=Loigolactobacillus coryniformis TaxID=1610 RepID=J3JBQ3_9LACO|nr:preprotein translocase subunit YajC [Loigolactobacillus coryniformis]MDN6252860.1 preprotein translocase subunit YajC [Lactiplantibacillus plantarum]OEH89424.1 preprotein translocase subunit YajC [Loigolactobacillus coryniformis subsp. coryniformis]RRG04234.1 MAG: preprotein translocase subunit YajC [Lactobacillus sp.]ATO44227.1 preprotein translocase subunit YajC [Loigolactobacillus coryniformis subsp. torquens DSM 20004 = KCTC 3535]ATO55891.1 preprotein translocase subunit YajC [Loigolact